MFGSGASGTSGAFGTNKTGTGFGSSTSGASGAFGTNKTGTGFGSSTSGASGAFGTNKTGTGFGFGASGASGAFGTNKTGTGFGFGASGLTGLGGGTTTSKVTEQTKLSELGKQLGDNAHNAAVHFIDIHRRMKHYQEKASRFSDIGAMDSQLRDLESDFMRTLKHNLLVLANEIDHGEGALSDAREQLRVERSLLSDGQPSVAKSAITARSEFFERFVDDLGQRAAQLTDAIEALTTKMSSMNSEQTTEGVKQALQQEFEAIDRCCVQFAITRKRIEELFAKTSAALDQKRGTRSDVSTELDLINLRKEEPLCVTEIMEKTAQFEQDRDNDLLNRHKDSSQFKTPTTSGGFGGGFGSFGSGFGAGKTGTSGFGSGFGATKTGFGSGFGATKTGTSAFGSGTSSLTRT